MRFSFYPLAAVALLATACTGTGNGPAATSPAADNGNVQTTDISERLLTTGDAYSFGYGDSTLYATNSITVQLLDKFGDTDLKPLRAALVTIIDNDSVPTGSTDVDSAMAAFIADTTYMLEHPERLDKLPAGAENGAWSKELSLKITELTHDYVTYAGTLFSYSGGAHPMTVVTPMTYAFATGQVLTVDNLFTAEGRARLPQVVTDALLRGINPPVDKLTQAGYFVDTLPMPSAVSLRGGMLVFHYGLYDIAPYVMGQTNVEVWPTEVSEMLTPLGRSLLVDNASI